jgi:ADP-ribose pyrophosphatase YjhB (NUDIX family)
LRREFIEETGLEVEVGPLHGVLSDITEMPSGTNLHTVRLIYGIRAYSGALRNEVGGSSDIARWITLEEAWDLPLRPYVRQALTELR